MRADELEQLQHDANETECEITRLVERERAIHGGAASLRDIHLANLANVVKRLVALAAAAEQEKR